MLSFLLEVALTVVLVPEFVACSNHQFNKILKFQHQSSNVSEDVSNMLQYR